MLHNLLQGCNLVVIELFCSKDSAIAKACRRAEVAYLGITQEENFFSAETQAFLKEALSVLGSRFSTKVYLHIATPCTAGCSWRFYNWKRPAFRRKWRLKLQEHQRCWKLIGSLLGPYAKEPALLVTQEWPKTSSLWKEEVYLKVKERLGLSFGRTVDRCPFDRVYKRWYFCSNREKWVDCFREEERGLQVDWVGYWIDYTRFHIGMNLGEASSLVPTGSHLTGGTLASMKDPALGRAPDLNCWVLLFLYLCFGGISLH